MPNTAWDIRPARGPLPYCGCYIIVDSAPKYLPLVNLDARSSIVSSTSRTTLTQTFVNPSSDSPLQQARYRFPLYDGVSVVAFTCTVGPRVIRGVVKELREAKKAYDKAVSKGETAGLLEQSEEASDVFTTTLGNIPAGENVKVEITYLGELKHDAEIDGLRFTIPTSIAPRYGEHSLALATEGINASASAISITVDTDMPDGSVIKSIQSPSHPISVSMGATSTSATAATPSLQRASATLSLGSAELDKDFIVQVAATGLGDPAAVLETHSTIPNRRALMTTLVPRFNLPVETPEVVFVCDRSGSMSTGRRIPNLIAALKIFLKSLPVGVKFNICSFGSRCSFLWKQSQTYDQDTLDKAIHHVEDFSANFGGTEMLQPIKETFERRYQDMNLEVFLLTDGEIWDQSELFGLINDEVAKSKGAVRFFTLGVGVDVSHALIEGVARAGNGFAQTVAENEKMDKKIVRMLKGALTPHVTDYTLEVKYGKGECPTTGDHDDDDADDDFEMVEKVMDALTIDVQDEPDKASQSEKGEGPDNKKSGKKPISLFDPSLEDQDLDMPQASNLPEVKLPSVTAPRYLQAPFNIPPLFPFNRTTVYVLLSDSAPTRQPRSVVLRGTSKHGPLALEIPIKELAEKGTTIHQLAARKAIGELEEGRGWIYHAKDGNGKLIRKELESRFNDMIKREAVRLGVEYQVGGRWCSFVAVQENSDQGEDVGEFGVVPAGHQSEATTRRGAERMIMSHMAHLSAARRTVRAPTGASAPMGRLNHIRGRGPPLARGGWTPVVEPGQVGQFHTMLPGNDDDDDDSQGDVGFSLFDAGSGGFDLRAMTKSTGKSPGIDANEPPLSALAALQSFSGSWEWSTSLEKVIGITKQHALSKINLSAQYDRHEDVLATLCAVAYLKKRLAEEKDAWELLVGKAEGWLADQTGLAAEKLEKIVDDGLFV